MLKPIDIYRAYPASALLDLNINDNLTVEALDRLTTGDNLFEFMVREFCSSSRERVSLLEANDRADQVIYDIRAVQKMIGKKIEDIQTQVRRPMSAEEIATFHEKHPEMLLCVFFMEHQNMDCGLNAAAFQEVAVDYVDLVRCTYFNVGQCDNRMSSVPCPEVLPSFAIYDDGKSVWFHSGFCDYDTLAEALNERLGFADCLEEQNAI